MAPYFITHLIPRRDKNHESTRPLWTVLKSLTWLQWAQFFSGWFAWTCDAVDFFSVSLSINNLSADFGRSTHDITTAITLTLLLRTVGAIFFGVLSDRFGRRWPLVGNLVMICALEIGVSFVQTYRQFLAVRSIFGIGMGGIWGMAASTALENLPVEVRGLASGVLQQGYAVGYLLAACINLKLVPEVSKGWRSLFWCSAGFSATAATIRALLPESEVFLRYKKERVSEGTTWEKTKAFLKQTGTMLKKHWLLCIYSVLLMTGFNFLSHGSQDLYPTYLETSKNFSTHNATIATIIGNCGAICGGMIGGFLSQYIGRRLTIVLFVLLLGCFIPLWIIPSTFSSLAAGAFCVQIGVQGAWGVIPIFLAELSPSAYRATFPGVAYQLGNMVSSASAQIEATGGENFRTTVTESDGTIEDVPDYAKVQGILVGVVAAFVVAITILGPENHGAHFEDPNADSQGAENGTTSSNPKHHSDTPEDDESESHHNHTEKLGEDLHNHNAPKETV